MRPRPSTVLRLPSAIPALQKSPRNGAYVLAQAVGLAEIRCAAGQPQPPSRFSVESGSTGADVPSGAGKPSKAAWFCPGTSWCSGTVSPTWEPQLVRRQPRNALSPPYYEARFSNGPLWVETLASYLGDPPLPAEIPSAARITPGAVPRWPSPLAEIRRPFPEQISQYLGNLAAANETITANDVFAVWGGTNDYLDTFLGAENGPTNPIDPAVSASALTDALADARFGPAPRTIVVNNLPLLGNIPYIRATDAFYQEGGALIASANAWSTTYNSDPGHRPEDPLSGVNVVLVDVAGLEEQVFQNPAQYGFTNTVNSWWAPSMPRMTG